MTLSVLRNLARAGRKRGVTWRYLFNFVPTVSYKFDRHALTAEAARVSEELREHGTARTSVSALLGDGRCYAELLEAVDSLESEHAARLADARSSSDDEGAIGRKTFNVEMLGGQPRLDLSSVYARFALQDEVLQIANAYFGMYTRLRYYNVWHTFATDGVPRESQLWHRDREDYHILKMFLYLSDVDEGAGPFTYAKGSHRKGDLYPSPRYTVEGGVQRSSDEQMAESIPCERWARGVGPRGTIIFADTSGYHKGGEARTRDRLMYTCMFTSPASQSAELLKLDDGLALPAHKAQAMALAPPRHRIRAARRAV